MRAQRGSILVGTLALSIVIASGAAGLLALAGFWSSSNLSRAERTRLYKAAESGLQMGKRWLTQNMDDGELTGFYTGQAEYPVTAGDNGVITLEGVRLKVTLTYVGGVHYLEAQAQLTPCTERIVVTWRINIITGMAPNSTTTFREWKESIKACAF